MVTINLGEFDIDLEQSAITESSCCLPIFYKASSSILIAIKDRHFHGTEKLKNIFCLETTMNISFV